MQPGSRCASAKRAVTPAAIPSAHRLASAKEVRGEELVLKGATDVGWLIDADCRVYRVIFLFCVFFTFICDEKNTKKKKDAAAAAVVAGGWLGVGVLCISLSWFGVLGVFAPYVQRPVLVVGAAAVAAAQLQPVQRSLFAA